ncbi:hypothetical protein CSB80_0008 [Staphylococcus aureus]|nr:hypothetical protein CSB80_0008 [Staphylococcus aureus]
MVQCYLLERKVHYGNLYLIKDLGALAGRDYRAKEIQTCKE